MGTLERERPWGMNRKGRLLDSFVLSLVNGVILLRHPVWMARVAYRHRRVPRIANPVTYHEKRVWRLIFDRNPMFVAFGDKLATKAWMSSEVSGLLAAKTLWVGDDPTQLSDEILAQGVVIKANRGCDQNLFVRTVPDSRALMDATLREWLAASYSEKNGRRYWQRLPQRVFAEEIIPCESALVDFCFFCCDGEVLFAVATVGEKTDQEAVAYFTPDGERIESIEGSVEYHPRWLSRSFRLPDSYLRAVGLAAQLSRQIDFVRVDIMCADERLYAGEMSPFPNVGPYMRTAFVEQAMERWDLRKSWFARTPQSGVLEFYRKHLVLGLGDNSAAASRKDANSAY